MRRLPAAAILRSPRQPAEPSLEIPLSRRLVLLLVTVALLVPAVAVAKKPLKRKALTLDPLGEEVAAAGEYTDDLYKVMRTADKCLDGDKNWKREQERPTDSLPVNQIYELLSSSVVCWQGAEKKAGKAGEIFAPASTWITARARYIEAYRSFLWAIVAKLEGDRVNVCRRLKTAMDEGLIAKQTASGLADGFAGTDAKSMGLQLDQEAQLLMAQIEDEYKHQKCAE
jgi:hypothetical protein